MVLKFPTNYKTILKKIDQIDPLKYGKTRNFIDGAVTCLSPYISRGVISTRQILDAVLLKGYKIHEIGPFVRELCWRDYFQRVGQHKDLNQNIKNGQRSVANTGISVDVVDGKTGIEGIDHAINLLYTSGYMHNHCRMYTAMLVCNIAKSHWKHPAQWMYYHLLDGDWASNSCSWQWVAGTNSSKKYYANQENINKFTYTQQSNTFLDISYDAFEELKTPANLLNTQKLLLKTALPNNTSINIDPTLPTFIYNYYNLDPLWHSEEAGNRILLLEPELFANYPVNDNCIQFMLDLSRNIPEIQFYTGSLRSLTNKFQLENVVHKEHPLNRHYQGFEDPRGWITEDINGYFPSFFTYWKKVEKQLIVNA